MKLNFFNRFIIFIKILFSMNTTSVLLLVHEAIGVCKVHLFAI